MQFFWWWHLSRFHRFCCSDDMMTLYWLMGRLCQRRWSNLDWKVVSDRCVLRICIVANLRELKFWYPFSEHALMGSYTAEHKWKWMVMVFSTLYCPSFLSNYSRLTGAHLRKVVRKKQFEFAAGYMIEARNNNNNIIKHDTSFECSFKICTWL